MKNYLGRLLHCIIGFQARQGLFCLVPILCFTGLTLADYSPDTSALPAQMVTGVKLHDARRGKDLEVAVVYPISTNRPGQRFPIIVFSHGAGASGAGYADLLEYWASHGYVCVAPTHADSLSLKTTPANALNHVNIALAEIKVIKDIGSHPNDWVQRAADVSFVLDSLSDLARLEPQVGPLMDRRHIGVGGHSYGAFTSMVIGGAAIDLPSHPASNFTDRRATAILVLSGQGPGTMGLTADSYAGLQLPMMVQTGDLDRSMSGKDWHWRMLPFDLSPSGDKYLLVIQSARHRTFTGQNLSSPAEKSAFETVRMTSLAFWDAYLKNDPAARAFLAQKRPVANAMFHRK
jgi:predicted dienelactone hydrolase